jgi:ABC-type multidrug transport system fused ATPase/permease subunit
VQRAVDRLARGRIVLSVAHRLSTLRNASRILVLEDGRAVGLGTQAELMLNCPTFRRLAEAQMGDADAADDLDAPGGTVPSRELTSEAARR